MSDSFEEFHKEMLSLYELYKEAQLGLAIVEEMTGLYPLSIVNEFKGSLHHFMEAVKEFEKNPSSTVWRKEIIKGKEEHLIRALFDSYNLCIEELKKGIRKKIEPFKAECVAVIFPEYNSEIEPYFENLVFEISAARINRSIDASLATFKEAVIQSGKYKRNVESHLPALEKFTREQKSKFSRVWVLTTICGIFATVVGGIIIYSMPSKTGPKNGGLKNKAQVDTSIIKKKENTNQK